MQALLRTDGMGLVLQTIAEMHAAGWAHVDLTPDNICVEAEPGRKPVPYVIDFGSATTVAGTTQRL